MAGKGEEHKGENKEMMVFRVSTAEEWEELQRSGETRGGDLDRSTGCIHLSDHHQVKMVLHNFFKEREDLYLLQIDKSKLGNGLIYEAIDETNSFPHFYGPNRSFIPLSLDTVVRSEKIQFSNGLFLCSMLD